MIIPRVVALAMMCASAAAQAQQSPPPTPQQPAASVAKPDNSQKVSCRVHMEGTMPKRVCMTNAEWAAVDGQPQNGLDQTYVHRHGCGADKGSVMGAC